MICVNCRRRQHQDCPGGTWCDCQHHTPQEAEEHPPESAMSWVRQG